MNTRFNVISSFSTLLILPFILMGTSELVAQEKKAEIKSFKIIVEKTDNGLKMKSTEGSAWIDLSFSLSENEQQAVDEYGMTKLNKVSSRKDTNLADFLFTVIRTEKGIELKGIEGTAWSELKLSLVDNQKRAINQFGMTSLD